jgi:hypothetical protein
MRVRCRLGHLAFILFQALWLNVVLPGHARGVVVLPGACGGIDRACCHRDQPLKGDTPAKRAANCAVCAFAARLSLPPVVDLELGRLGRIGIVQTPAAGDLVSLEFLPTYLGCGPPARV